MYSDDDLDQAVEKGLFTAESVQAFRQSLAQPQEAYQPDEEHFKLATSFNDIFVVIACLLLLFSSQWLLGSDYPLLSGIMVVVFSWGLSEFFVRQRKMALPAIVLLMAFVLGSYDLARLFATSIDQSLMLASGAASLAAFLHWKRFKVPITVAAGMLTLLAFLMYGLFYIDQSFKKDLFYFVFLGGVLTFVLAMRWDRADLQRQTGRSDVAFWLHLLAAPMMVHPVFIALGLLGTHYSLVSMIAVLVLYILLGVVSLIIDRRAFMVSSLAYVLYALSQLFEYYGFAGNSLAFVGLVLSMSLLLLSGFWSKARYYLMKIMPKRIQQSVPLARQL